MSPFSPTYTPSIQAKDLREHKPPVKPNAFDGEFSPLRQNVRTPQGERTNHKLAKSSKI